MYRYGEQETREGTTGRGIKITDSDLYLEVAPALATIARYAPAVGRVLAPIVAEKLGPKIIGGKPVIGERRWKLGIVVLRDLVPTLIDLYGEGEGK